MPNTWDGASTGAPSSPGTSGPVRAPGPAYPPAHSVNRSHTANTRSGSALNSPSLTVAASITPSPSMITRRPLARPMRMRPPSALGRVTSGHQRGQVLGLNERRRGRRTPVVQAAGALDDRRFPQLVVQDDVQVGVVLREVAYRVLQVPEEVGPDVVAAQPPDVPLRMAFQHRRGAPPDLVDVVDLPRGVVQEIHRCLLHQQVVMIRRAPHERGQPRHPVAHLEPQTLGEEPLRRFLI